MIEAEAHHNVPEERKGSGREIRYAKPGAWRDHLTDEEVEAMDAVFGDRLSANGYV
jgi:hypothetical protein